MGSRLSLAFGLIALFVACSTFSEESSGDAGNDAGVGVPDGAALDGGTVDVCKGACESLCEVGIESSETYGVTILSTSTPTTSAFEIFPATSTAVEVLDDVVPDEDATRLSCVVEAPQQLVFFHAGPVPNGKTITRVIARARIRRNTLVERSGTGFRIGLVKGDDPNRAPKAVGPWRTVGSTTFVVQSVAFTTVPGSGAPFTGVDVDGVTILLGFHPESMNAIHVTKAWIEVCRAL